MRCVLCKQTSCRKVIYTACCSNSLCIDCIIERLKIPYKCPFCGSIDKPLPIDYVYKISENKLLTYNSKHYDTFITPILPRYREKRIEEDERETSTPLMAKMGKCSSILTILGFIFYCCINNTT